MVHIKCLFGDRWLNDEILTVECCIMSVSHRSANYLRKDILNAPSQINVKPAAKEEPIFLLSNSIF